MSIFIGEKPKQIVENVFSTTTRGDLEIRGKMLLNRVAFIDCNENLQI